MTRALRRNVASGAIVLALHIGFIAALMIAMTRQATLPVEHITEVYLPAQAHRAPPSPAMAAPQLRVFTPDVPVPNIDIEPAAPSTSSLGGVGHALFGCEADKLATPEGRAHCPRFSLGRPQQPSLRLPPLDTNSPFAQVIAKRNAPVVPMEHVCTPQESPQANLGLPCYTFPGGKE